MNQLEMFAPQQQRQAAMTTAESVRPRLETALRQLRDGSSTKWTEAERRRRTVVFPRMSEWLPPAERTSLNEEFKRLSANLDAVKATL